MNIEVIKFDNLGRGIGYINNKIIFIPKSVPGDILKVDITLEKKNYLEGKIVEIIKPSKLRQKVICPYFDNCGGCDLLQISYTENLEYKLKKINDILNKNQITYQVKDIIKSDERYNYRNKINLKVKDGIIGFFASKSHQIIEIKNCYLCQKAINEILKDLHVLEVNNGAITIRCNYNEEVLLIIDTVDELKNIDVLLNNHKIVGIIKNNECIYGSNFFVDKIGSYLFKVSYDSFFQINPFVCEKLFLEIGKNIVNSSKVLDLYCGVGSLTLVAATNAQNAFGVEIVENAINDANTNKALNKIENINFLCADTKNVIDKINKDYNTIILDPPRSGVIKEILDKIMEEKIAKIIYISCDPNTLVRDLKILEKNYEIKKFILLDMFANCEHVESLCVLKLR